MRVLMLMLTMLVVCIQAFVLGIHRLSEEARLAALPPLPAGVDEDSPELQQYGYNAGVVSESLDVSTFQVPVYPEHIHTDTHSYRWKLQLWMMTCHPVVCTAPRANVL